MTAASEGVRPQPDEAAVTLGRTGTVGVIALAALRLAEAILWAATALGLRPMPFGLGDLTIADVEVGPPLLLCIAALDVAIVFGLLLSRRWGWILTMLVTGVGLAFNILLVLSGEQDPIRLAILVATALFLNQIPVRARFGMVTT